MVELRADIELPLPPQFPWLEVATIAVGTALLVGSIALCRTLIDRSASKKRARAPTARPLDEIQIQAADAREQAYRTAALLRSHFKLQQLDPEKPPREVTDTATWSRVVDQLMRQRYQASARDDLSEDVLETIRNWLSAEANAGGPG